MSIEPIGTCFVIAAMGSCVLAVTAKHCLEYASTFDVERRVKGALGSPFVIEEPVKVWNRIELQTILRSPDLPVFLSLPVDVDEAYARTEGDIAYLLMRPHADYQHVSLRDQLPLFSKGPEKGETVYLPNARLVLVENCHDRGRIDWFLCCSSGHLRRPRRIRC
jgi:hypothetical protein